MGHSILKTQAHAAILAFCQSDEQDAERAVIQAINALDEAALLEHDESGYSYLADMMCLAYDFNDPIQAEKKCLLVMRELLRLAMHFENRVLPALLLETDAFCRVLISGSKPLLQTYLDNLDLTFKRGWISQQQYVSLFLSLDKAGLSTVQYALFSGQYASVNLYYQAVERLLDQKWLTLHEYKVLFSRPRKQGSTPTHDAAVIGDIKILNRHLLALKKVLTEEEYLFRLNCNAEKRGRLIPSCFAHPQAKQINQFLANERAEINQTLESFLADASPSPKPEDAKNKEGPTTPVKVAKKRKKKKHKKKQETAAMNEVDDAIGDDRLLATLMKYCHFLSMDYIEESLLTLLLAAHWTKEEIKATIAKAVQLFLLTPHREGFSIKKTIQESLVRSYLVSLNNNLISYLDLISSVLRKRFDILQDEQDRGNDSGSDSGSDSDSDNDNTEEIAQLLRHAEVLLTHLPISSEDKRIEEIKHRVYQLLADGVQKLAKDRADELAVQMGEKLLSIFLCDFKDPSHTEMEPIYFLLGCAYHDMANSYEALHYFRKSAKIREKEDFPKELIACYGKIVHCLSILGLIQDSLIYRKKIENLQALQDELAPHFWELADRNFHVGLYEKALEFGEQALQLYEAEASVDHHLYRTLGHSCIRLNLPQKALVFYGRIEEETATIHEFLGTAYRYQFLGTAHRCLGNKRDAEINYQKATLIYEQQEVSAEAIYQDIIGDGVIEVAEEYEYLAELHYRAGSRERAEDCLKKALRVYALLDQPENMRRIKTVYDDVVNDRDPHFSGTFLSVAAGLHENKKAEELHSTSSKAYPSPSNNSVQLFSLLSPYQAAISSGPSLGLLRTLQAMGAYQTANIINTSPYWQLIRIPQPLRASWLTGPSHGVNAPFAQQALVPVARQGERSNTPTSDAHRQFRQYLEFFIYLKQQAGTRRESVFSEFPNIDDKFPRLTIPTDLLFFMFALIIVARDHAPSEYKLCVGLHGKGMRKCATAPNDKVNDWDLFINFQPLLAARVLPLLERLGMCHNMRQNRDIAELQHARLAPSNMPLDIMVYPNFRVTKENIKTHRNEHSDYTIHELFFCVTEDSIARFLACYPDPRKVVSIEIGQLMDPNNQASIHIGEKQLVVSGLNGAAQYAKVKKYPSIMLRGFCMIVEEDYGYQFVGYMYQNYGANFLRNVDASDLDRLRAYARKKQELLSSDVVKALCIVFNIPYEFIERLFQRDFANNRPEVTWYPPSEETTAPPQLAANSPQVGRNFPVVPYARSPHRMFPHQGRRRMGTVQNFLNELDGGAEFEEQGVRHN